MQFLNKYGVARHIYIPIVKRAVVDFAVGADWTPAAGDCSISKDGGARAALTNLPTAIAMSNTAMWDFSLTATEMQAAQIVVMVADSATKAVEDQSFIIETYGNASGQHAFDLATATQKVDIDTIKTNPVVNGGTITFPTTATLASTTNLTAGTIATVSGNVNGSVGSVTGAVGSVTGAVGSVTGAVGSVGAGGIAAASFAAGAIDAASIAADAIGTSELAATAATEIAAATWNEATSGHTTAGTYGDKFGAHLPAVLKAIIGAGSTTTAIKLNAATGIDGAAPSAVDDYYNGAVLIFTSGALAGQRTSITDYAGATTTLTVVAVTSAPANADTAVIV